jgi:uncharacterized protein YndB with AHSA1/START domain
VALLHDSIEIAAMPKRVFEYLADVERVPAWMPNMIEARRTSEIEAGPGAEIAVVVNAAGKRRQGTCRIVEWDAPRRFVLESILDLGVTSKIAFDVARVGRQTQVSATIEYTLTGRGFGRMLGGMFGDRVARRDMRAALESLKAQIEAEKPRRARPSRVASARPSS